MSFPRRGFTLIELLVVVAIIGVLSSVVLASLTTARNKGVDAAVKSNLEQARTQGELFYSANNNSYDGGTAPTSVCNPLASAGGLIGANRSILAAAQAIGQNTVTLLGTGATSVCNSNAGAWVAQVPLKSVAGFFCIDSTGVATTTLLASPGLVSGAGDFAC
jgi:prepilin-type N-terminal cleavage/methylation domain-containing protein